VKSARKQLREAQPFWATRELSLNPEVLCMTMLDALPLFIPGEPLAAPVAFSPKAKLYPHLCGCLHAFIERAGAGRVARLVKEYNRVLWAWGMPPLVEEPREITVDVGSLLQVGQVDAWFTAPPTLGRILLHQLVEMPDQHVLLLLSPVLIGDKAGHLLGLGFLDGEGQIQTYVS